MAGDEERRALETMDHVLTALRALGERDHPLNRLIDSIEDDRAHLLALALGSHASGRVPPRMTTVVEDARPARPPRPR
jgi:hypothetical protein